MENTDESEEPVRNDVATSILLFKGKILILKRSNKVGTYKGKWACVSGYIEENETPYETAIKEIGEELGLGGVDVELIKEGEVILARDGEYLWAIHPFLFEIKNPNITLDWEHDEFRWIQPEELEKYLTVPKLKETIEIVLSD
jgi:8-oxo-dGTP pyrophosphatase MutT (NUDIX family)